jgi:hypothetical protein
MRLFSASLVNPSNLPSTIQVTLGRGQRIGEVDRVPGTLQTLLERPSEELFILDNEDQSHSDPQSDVVRTAPTRPPDITAGAR